MKVVNILGGLGNQMFQYAFAVALQHEFPEEVVKINTQCFRGYPLHNGYELSNLFDVKLPFASVNELLHTAYPWAHYRLWQLGRRLLPQRKSMAWDSDFPNEFSFEFIKTKKYFDGYWQSEKFFSKHRSAVVNAMTFPEINDESNLKALKFIACSKTAFLHIRRGDYINHPILGGICNLNYYKRGIDLLRMQHGFIRFIVFSNDITWCKENLNSELRNSEVLYVDWNKGANSFRDMQLMSKCNGGLIANSSFSWWGAWLSDAEIIYCPARWTNNDILNDVTAERWIKIIT
ncbi:MAG: alpha-1,2-fucosyltransferase [Bacteroidales bacterium]|nr:alpha-1,2-fucosyltransferase [Bacteroidales bacterium]